MQTRYRHLLQALLLLALFCAAGLAGCQDNALPVSAPEPTAAPTATPAPSLSPSPTPEPTPSPRPTRYLGDAEADALLLSHETLELRRSRTNQIRLYESPSLDAPWENARNTTTETTRSEVIVLSETSAPDGTRFYYVRTAFDGREGYMPVDGTRESELQEEGVSGFALIQRPGCPVYRATKAGSRVLAREDYAAVRVLGSYRGFYFVVTQDGVYGYVDPAQLRMVTQAEMEQYLAAGTLADAAETFSAAAFADALEARAGEAAESTEALLLDALTRAGLYFSPGYYRHFEKPLGDALLYPQGLYQDEVYNSLLFKLWNSAGNLVQCAGQETEWAHVADYADVQRGDLLFFAEYAETDTAIVQPYEVVLRGPDSGYVTACGVALGGDRMLTVQDGVVTVVESLSESPLMACFDSARRIYPAVTDAKAHLIECMISAIYDRLGTPYDNIVRTGDESYDCSGIICWTLRTLDVRRERRDDGAEMQETTASGLSNIQKLYRFDTVIETEKLNERLRVLEDIERLERGDLVFLYNEQGTRMGHVMLYLGDGNVIHSTTVSDEYRGTLVAGFRPELKELYACARRIASISPIG